MSSEQTNTIEASVPGPRCPSCGNALPEGALFCPHCGTKVQATVTPEVGSAPTAAPVQAAGVDPDGSLRDRATGFGLFRGAWPAGWSVAGTALDQTGTVSRPYLARVELHAPAGDALLRVEQGEAGQQESGGMQALMAMYGGAAAPYDTAHKAPMPDPLAVADAYAASLAGGSVRLLRELASSHVDQAQARATEHYQAQARAVGIPVSSPFGAQVLRIYAFNAGGVPAQVAVFVEEWAMKQGTGVADRIGGMFGGRGSARQPQEPSVRQSSEDASGESRLKDAAAFFMGGGLIGKKLRESRATQQVAPQVASAPQVPEPAAPAQSATSAPVWCSPDYASYVQHGTIYWSVDRVISLVAPQDSFDEAFRTAFLPVVGSVAVHADVKALAAQEEARVSAAIMGNTQQQLAASNARFQAQQAAHRQQQAAFNSYNDSISAARDARQASFRTTGGSGSGGSVDYAEAIRGVNSYETSDGRVVEVSVHADRAYENRSGDVVGASGGIDPGADWTEIPRV